MEDTRCDLKYQSTTGISLRCGLTKGHEKLCGPAPLLTGYGAKVGGGWTLILGVTPNEFERLEREPFSVPVSDQYRPLHDVLIVFGRNKDELRAAINHATHSRNVPLMGMVEKPRVM
jgi:hypothetical protein